MAFEIFEEPRKRMMRNARWDECKRMFKMLDGNRELCAVVDMESSHVRHYAKKLGYKISCSYVEPTKTKLWVVDTFDPSGALQKGES